MEFGKKERERIAYLNQINNLLRLRVEPSAVPQWEMAMLLMLMMMMALRYKCSQCNARTSQTAVLSLTTDLRSTSVIFFTNKFRYIFLSIHFTSLYTATQFWLPRVSFCQLFVVVMLCTVSVSGLWLFTSFGSHLQLLNSSLRSTELLCVCVWILNISQTMTTPSLSFFYSTKHKSRRIHFTRVLYSDSSSTRCFYFHHK